MGIGVVKTYDLTGRDGQGRSFTRYWVSWPKAPLISIWSSYFRRFCPQSSKKEYDILKTFRSGTRMERNKKRGMIKKRSVRKKNKKVTKRGLVEPDLRLYALARMHRWPSVDIVGLRILVTCQKDLWKKKKKKEYPVYRVQRRNTDMFVTVQKSAIE